MRKKPHWIAQTPLLSSLPYYREVMSLSLLHERKAGQHTKLPKVIWFFMRKGWETKLRKDKHFLSVKFLSSLFKDLYGILTPSPWGFCPHSQSVSAIILQLKNVTDLNSVIFINSVTSYRQTPKSEWLSWPTHPLTW